MAITSEQNIRYRYNGDGSTATFPFPSKTYNQTYLVVKILDTSTSEELETLVLTTDYSVTINNDGTSSITVVSGKIPASGEDILIRLELPITQDVELPRGTSLPSSSIETALDKLTTLSAVLSDNFDRSIAVSENEDVTGISLIVPIASERASKFMAFDASGNATVASGTGSTTPISSTIEPFLAATSLANARTELGVYSTSEVDSLVGTLPTLSGDNAFTGSNTFTTQSYGDNSTKAATTAFVYSNANVVRYVTCSTAAATAEKVITISGFTPKTGDRIVVNFTNGNTANAPTLNLNSTGALTPIDEAGNAASSTYPQFYPSGVNVEFVYNGTTWILVCRVVENYANTTTGYYLWSDGKKVQWGQASLVTAGTTITFPLSFMNSNYSVQATVLAAGVLGTAYIPFINKVSTSYMIGYMGATGGVMWVARGY